MIVNLVIGGLCSIAAFLAGWFIQFYRLKSEKGVPEEEMKVLREEKQRLETEVVRLEERGKNSDALLEERTKESEFFAHENSSLKETRARMQSDLQNMKQSTDEKLAEYQKMKEQLKSDFEVLSGKLLEQARDRLKSENKESLLSLLNPLQDKIKEFREKVDSTHKDNIRERTELKEQLKSLHEMNSRMSEEASNLTNALKGQSKTMGNWGELVLETILEKSGLIKGEEYLIQPSFKNEEGKTVFPDVIINLPDQKHLVIDSKVSLLAYETHFNAENEEIAEKALKDHLLSLKNHIRSLAEKRYQDLYDISAPDFVMMFVPVDPALIVALQADTKLFLDAFDRGVYLVSPATLLFSLRTIANLWKGEKQNRNALEIARQGGNLYDKFAGFVDNLKKLGGSLEKSQSLYEESVKQLSTGKGNLLKRVEDLKQLGIKTEKQLPLPADEE